MREREREREREIVTVILLDFRTRPTGLNHYLSIKDHPQTCQKGLYTSLYTSPTPVFKIKILNNGRLH